MKILLITLAIVATLFPAVAQAQEPIVAHIISAPPERLGLMKGEIVSVSAGRKDGIIKGDIGTIAMRRDGAPGEVVGRCAVTKTSDALSDCEIVKADREVERGYFVFFQPVRFSDPVIYPAVLNVLNAIVEPYAPSKSVRVYIYNIFDDKGNVTKFSESVRNEIGSIFSQKKRIVTVDARSMREIAFYPEDYPAMAGRIKEYQRKSDIDAVVWGYYRMEANKVLLTLSWIDRNFTDQRQAFSLPLEPKYAASSSEIVTFYGQIRKVEDVTCTLLLKAMPARVTKDERTMMIRREAEGNPFVEQQLRAIDFAIVSPVDVQITIDRETIRFDGKDEHTMILPRGQHKLVASYKRGYYVQEALLYKSTRELTKEIVLDVKRSQSITIQLRCAPLDEKEPLELTVYKRVAREQALPQPIPSIQTDITIETFKD
jgi:hypothetical protein